MKIERDKWYVTRGGGKRRVVCVDGRSPYSVVSLDENGAAVASMTEDGRVFSDSSRLHPSDLVKEYREPKVIYVNEYAGLTPGMFKQEGYIYTDKQEALRQVGSNAMRAGVKYIEVMED